MKKQKKLFILHVDYIKKFKTLKEKYSKGNTVFKYTASFSDNLAFVFMVDYVKEKFKAENNYLKAPDEFIAQMRLPGKRKLTNSNALSKKNKGSINVNVPIETIINYIDIIYSWNNINEIKYNSTTSFFYQFIDIIENSKSKFLKFKN